MGEWLGIFLVWGLQDMESDGTAPGTTGPRHAPSSASWCSSASSFGMQEWPHTGASLAMLEKPSRAWLGATGNCGTEITHWHEPFFHPLAGWVWIQAQVWVWKQHTASGVCAVWDWILSLPKRNGELCSFACTSPGSVKSSRFPWPVAFLWVITWKASAGCFLLSLGQTPSHPTTYCCFLQHQLNRWQDSNHHSLNGICSPQ